MATLTPLSKGLVALVILSSVSAAAWHLGIKGVVADWGKDSPEPDGPAVAGGTPGAAAPGGTAPVAAAPGTIGTAASPLTVSFVSFHGYAPAIVSNGNSLTTQPGSIYAEKGVNVRFLINDDVPTLTTLFESGQAQCAWRTSDFWAQEQPNLRNANHDGKAILVVDNTRGGDAVITRDPSIRSIEDLASHSVALLQYTPSHGLLIDALANSSLSARKRESISMSFVAVEEGTGGVRAAFESGNVDAAVLWDPDLSLALRAPGAHVVYSTKNATDLIFDVMVCDKRVLDNPANVPAIQAFVDGWLDGVKVVEADRTKGVEALKATEQMFTLLAQKEGDAFVASLFDNIDLTDLADNARILGLAGGSNSYERVYRQFDGIYRGIGALANPNSPVINPSDSFDYRFVKAALGRDAQAKVEAAKPQFTFTAAEAKQVAAKPEAAAVTKPVAINFDTGKADLSKRAQSIIDEEMVPLIENNGSAYFEISGNTDSTGSQAVNARISKARAQVVVDYLVKEWEFPATRFVVVGNGSSEPICDEANPGADGLTLDECRAANRSTRAAVLAK